MEYTQEELYQEVSNNITSYVHTLQQKLREDFADSQIYKTTYEKEIRDFVGLFTDTVIKNIVFQLSGIFALKWSEPTHFAIKLNNIIYHEMIKVLGERKNEHTELRNLIPEKAETLHKEQLLKMFSYEIPIIEGLQNITKLSADELKKIGKTIEAMKEYRKSGMALPHEDERKKDHALALYGETLNRKQQYTYHMRDIVGYLSCYYEGKNLTIMEQDAKIINETAEKQLSHLFFGEEHYEGTIVQSTTRLSSQEQEIIQKHFMISVVNKFLTASFNEITYQHIILQINEVEKYLKDRYKLMAIQGVRKTTSPLHNPRQ